MKLNKLNAALITATVLLSANAVANDQQSAEYHDADPRNSSKRIGVFADQDGEIKLLAGGGAAGLTSDISQTIGFAEYYTQSNNARLRAAHFDSFGGVYVDIYHLDESAGMFTAGYMLPLSSDNGTQFFPSLNYTYLDFKTDDIADMASGIPGSPLPPITSKEVAEALGGEEAHLGSVNLYALHAWNETHFSVFNVNLGSSYGGVDMNVANLMWLQGIKTQVGEQVVNVIFELKYDYVEIQNTAKGDINSDGFTASIGVDFRF